MCFRTLPRVLNVSHRAVLPILGTPVASKMDLFVACGVLAISIYSLRISLDDNVLKWDLLDVFLSVLSEYTNCLIVR